MSMSNPIPSAQRRAYLRARKRRKTAITLLQILLPVLFLGLWELSARLGWVDMFVVS